MGPFGQVYARLVEQGYSVLPIMPGTKKPGLPSNNSGGWMDFPRWTTFQSTYAHHKHWALSSAGIGVRCGLLSGYLVVIDIDTDDPGILETLCKILPATPVKKKGARGESWFYYGPDIASRAWLINGCKVVEILGAGRQTVLPPTIHPDLGEPYRWTGSKTLEELRPQDLPLLPPGIVEQIDAVLAPFGYVPPEPRVRTSGGDDGLGDEIDAADDPHRRLNEAALANLDAWVPDLDLYNCRPTRGGYEAVATWRPSTTGREAKDRNRNLKIMPNGIRDFGEGKGYTAIDLVIAAHECDLEKAFAFLNEHLEWSGGEPLLDISALDISNPASTPKVEMLGLNDDGDSNGSSNGNGAGIAGTHAGASGGAHTSSHNGGAHNGGSQASAQASVHNGGSHNGGASSDAQANASQASAQIIPLFKPVVPPLLIPPWRSFQESSSASDPKSSTAGTPTHDLYWSR
jgi:hypothetical protein